MCKDYRFPQEVVTYRGPFHHSVSKTGGSWLLFSSKARGDIKLRVLCWLSIPGFGNSISVKEWLDPWKT